LERNSLTSTARKIAGAQSILVTGGAGYIGSHTMLELLAAGYDVVCVDNFSNSAPEAVHRCEVLAGRSIRLIRGDVRDPATLDRAFAAAPIAAVVHFAALKAVGESVARPLDYYDNNVAGTLALLRACARAGVQRFVFSSSATVYGVPKILPLTEDAPLSTTSPYGATKLMVEQILQDTCRAAPAFSVVALRYFNPIGAHASGRIGEDPRDIPNNLFPFVNQVAVGRRERLSIFGGDWPTPDGTGVRDYIHVVDIARGHLKALQHSQNHPGFVAVNLGTGRGTSVLELLQAVERACGRKIPYTVVERRAGDIAACWADVNKARDMLGWTAQYGIDQMCADGWRWQQGNPDGYRSDPSTIVAS
jgi:UDP-glucose 4-epimerase